MCGRFSQAYTWEEIVAFSQPLTVPANRPNLQPRYNIAPTTEIDIITLAEDGGRQMIKARWGLIPSWHRGEVRDLKASTFNARAESVHEKPMFRGAFKSRRCIIPASGFFEWTGDKGGKTPHYFSAADGSLLAFAGLWEQWRDPQGTEIITATIIVREGNAWMKKYHDRMPMMLQPKDFDVWLNGTAGKDVFEEPSPALREWIVSQRVNKAGAGDDDPATIAPEPGPLL